MLGVAVVCAETTSGPRWLAGPARLSFLRLRSGRPGRFPTPEEAAGATTSRPSRRPPSHAHRPATSSATRTTVRAELDELLARTGADELMLTTMVHDHADRLRSYELVAGLWAGVPATARA